MSGPSLLLVHGGWHRPQHWKLLTDELPGVDVHSVALPSSGDDPIALGDMFADAEAIAAAVGAIDGPVVVVAHSAGGVPATQALVGTPNVRRIIYVAAFQLDVGQSMLSSIGGVHAPWWTVDPDLIAIAARDSAHIFYGDVDADLAQWAIAQLWPYQSYAAATQRLTAAAWKLIPSTYIICEADNALPLSVQELWAKRAEKVLRMKTSHAPFLSQPAELAQLIEGELTAAAGS